MKRIFIILLLFAVIAVAYFLYDSHNNAITPAHYVGMRQCNSCHSVQSYSLMHTLHTKIFRPVTSLDEILADFKNVPSFVKFKKSDIEYVVGSKWEQVYMRKKGNDYYVFPAKWLITTHEWMPFKIHTFKQDRASVQCNKCHTTGYSQDTHGFKEFGVTCEACHGPASKHVAHQQMQQEKVCKICHKNRKKYINDIIVSQKSAVCGQCHTRGTTTIVAKNGKTTLFNFPLEYLPGNKTLGSSFVQSSPKRDKNAKFWWGKGLSKNRHQEFADFSFSKHSKALINLKMKKNPHGGKKDASCLQCHSEDYRSAKVGEKPTIESAKLGITCVTCHEPHGIDKNIRSKSSVDAKCAQCHIFDIKQKTKHYPCPSSKASCIGCHMPLIGKSGGAYTIRSHAFHIVPPEATKKYGMPSSCQNGACHKDKSVEWAIKAYQDFYHKKPIKSLADVINGK